MRTEARSFTALVNPISGTRQAAEVWAAVERHLRRAGAEVITEMTRSRAHAMEQATRAAERGDVVVAVGGDGLVRDASGGVVPAAGTLAIVPAGRGNDLTRTMAFPRDPAELAELLLHGPEQVIDVLDVNGVIVPGNAYLGVDSLANRTINSNRWIPSLLLYRLAGIVAVAGWRPATFTVDIDGAIHRIAGSGVVVANSGAYGHGLRIVPPAALDDGLLDVMIVGDMPRWKIITFIMEAREGRHIQRPEISLFTGQSVKISVDRPVPLFADGDEVGELPAMIQLRRSALRVIAPVVEGGNAP